MDLVKRNKLIKYKHFFFSYFLIKPYSKYGEERDQYVWELKDEVFQYTETSVYCADSKTPSHGNDLEL